jgi:YHS domain-containing protein
MHRPNVALALALIAPLALAACTAESPKPTTGAMPGAGAAPAPAAGAPAAAAGYTEMTPSANYPLKTCVVSGEKLGGMGKTKAISYQGREVQFCCGDCIADFMKEPAKYLAMLDAAKK